MAQDERMEEYIPLTPEEEGLLKECLSKCEHEDAADVLKDMLSNIIRGYATEEPRVSSTVKHMNEICSFRKKHDFSTITTRSLPLAEKFNACWPTRFHGEDKYGHIIMSEELKEISHQEILSTFETLDEVCLLRAQSLEYTMLKKRQLAKERPNKVCYKHIYVINLQGLSWAHFTSSVQEMLKRVFATGNSYYPETLWTFHVVNAPFMFRAMWAIISMWLHPITRKKIQIHGSSPLAAMEKQGMPASELPPWCGGTNQGVLFYDELLRSQEKQRKAAAAAAIGTEGNGEGNGNGNGVQAKGDEEGAQAEGAAAAAAAAAAMMVSGTHGANGKAAGKASNGNSSNGVHGDGAKEH